LRSSGSREKHRGEFRTRFLPNLLRFCLSLRSTRGLAVLCVLYALSHASIAAYQYDWTYDERFHLDWSRRLLETGETERTGTWAANSKTPIMILNVLFQNAARSLGFDSDRSEKFSARLPSLLWFALLIGVAGEALRRHFGGDAAVLLVTALSLDPNLIGHASIATVDVAFACTAFFCLLASVRFWESPSWKSSCGLIVGLWLAVTAKFSGLLLIPLVVLFPPLCGIRPAKFSFLAVFKYLLLMVPIGWFLLCASYGFQGLGEIAARNWQTTLLSNFTRYFSVVASLIPVDFLTGIDQSLSDDQLVEWNSIIFDRRYPDGVWYYFLVLWGVKTPIVLTLFSALGIGIGIAKRKFLTPYNRLFLLSFILLLAYFSLIFRTQVGYRFVLMCIPISYLLATQIWGLAARWKYFSRVFVVGVVLVLAEHAPYFGNPLSFSNSLIFDKKSAYRVLADSNINYGQHDDRIRDFVWSSKEKLFLNPFHFLKGRNIVDINYYTGVHDGEYRDLLRNGNSPDGHIDHTHLIFDIDESEFEALLQEKRRVRSDYLLSSLCDSGAWKQHTLTARSVLRVDQEVCIAAEKTADVSVYLEQGLVGFPMQRGWEILSFGDYHLKKVPKRISAEAWFRIAGDGTPIYIVAREPAYFRVEQGEIRYGPIRSPDTIISDRAIPPACREGIAVQDLEGKSATLFVRGSFNYWAAFPPFRMFFRDGCYTAAIWLPRTEAYETIEFKIAPDDWSDPLTYGTSGENSRPVSVSSPGETWVSLVANDPMGLGEGGNVELKVENAGIYGLFLKISPDAAQKARLTVIPQVTADGAQRQKR